jgi:hypothetical protein
MKRITVLPREISLKYPSNKFIVGLSLFAFFVAFPIDLFFNGHNLFEASIFSVNTFLSVFLVWAVMREFEPDRPVFANVASVLTLIYYIIDSAPIFLILDLLLILLVLRMVVRSTGPKFTWFDLVIVFAAGAYLGITNDSWIYFDFISAAFLLDLTLSNRNKKAIYFLFLSLIGVVYYFAKNLFDNFNFEFSNFEIFLLLTAIAGIIYAIFNFNKEIKSKCDLTNERINRERLLFGRLLGSVFLLIYCCMISV